MDANIMLTCIIVLLLISVGLNIFNTYKLEKERDNNPFDSSKLSSNSFSTTPFYRNTPNYQGQMMGMEETPDMDIGPTNGMRRIMQTNMNGLQGTLPDMAANLGGPRNMGPRNMGPRDMGPRDMGPPGVEPFTQSPVEMYRRFNNR